MIRRRVTSPEKKSIVQWSAHLFDKKMYIDGVFTWLFLTKAFRSGELIVGTKSGAVRGFVDKNLDGDDFYSFKGIPYAEPPVGPMRFRDPEPVMPWTGIKDAVNFGSECTQTSFIAESIHGQEDCLYLNVYTKLLGQDSEPLPVMFWIHGGAYITGDGSDSVYGPDYLLRKDIVLVTLNYRLGALGFLTLEHEIASGNQGLKDQLLALQWVKDNIASFGGNPEQITIFGESAGGISSHYLTQSPLAQGLYSKAIFQSGVTFSPWALPRPDPKQFAYLISSFLGHPSEDPEDVLEFLRTIDHREIVKAQEKITTKEMRLKGIYPFLPALDEMSKRPFMPSNFKEATQEGLKVPILLGYTSREGILHLDHVRESLDKYNNDFENTLHPNVVEYLYERNISAIDLKRKYYGNDELSESNIPKLLDLLGDIFLVESTHKVVRIQVEKTSEPVYLYKYTYDREMSPLKKVFRANMSGASHGDELQHLFRAHLMEQVGLLKPIQKGTPKYRLMEQMVEMWVNFAQTGKPTLTETNLLPVQWDPVNDSHTLQYLNIGEKLQMETTVNLEHSLALLSSKN
ncbi:hypothetical protein QAD02_004453 [Eretmocerus hayati]|uniref:Uncharacterized protein n=1 Tax=Eretmocerus hayati TaxID=131215 RepID=A0ACC2NPX6_9HYME|nr:hypothetical protein QAD02_004453 [Eretmocerus hayati]